MATIKRNTISTSNPVFSSYVLNALCWHT